MWFGDQTLPQIHDDQPRAGRAALAMGFARPALSSYTTGRDTTGALLRDFSREECAAYFKAAGYAPP